MTEFEEMRTFILEAKVTSNNLPSMIDNLRIAIGWSQRAGELEIEAKKAYLIKREECLAKLSCDESETETTRRTKLDAWTAEAESEWAMWKLIRTELKHLRMLLHTAIKTEREQPI